MPTISLRLFILLLLYHMLFTLVFHHYLMVHGGDSRAYWEFSIGNYRPASQWMDYFEYGNFFMQWLNYFPAKQWGLPYYVGNMIYGLLAFVGFAELLRLGLAHWGWNSSSRWANGWIAALFLPGIHFWTAGVGKEAILWIGTIWVLKGLAGPFRNGYWTLLGIFLALMTRPIHGALLIGMVLFFVITDPNVRSAPYRWYLWSTIGTAGIVALLILQRQTHLPAFSLQALADFLSSQQRFLESFGAFSYVPMHEYTWPERLWAVLFRPLPWEAVGIWQWAAALENSLLLLAFIAAIVRYCWYRPHLHLPRFLTMGLLLTGGMLLIYMVTLNNLGIIMRMKSIFTPFIGILCARCIVFSKKHPTFDRI
ncbi:hypothetical protein [Lunatimonas salinarum]|uniref:hypothetical protein n=1 Tax=Lunatimonas salinarum TaxID=1774590 RepID=UPI001AE0866F|nr:hypothetical protein [Lunatimonas salinarum]